jgi:hypothetical protein
LEQERGIIDFYQDQETGRAQLLERLQLAVAETQVAAVVDHLNSVEGEYLRHRQQINSAFCLIFSFEE